MYYAKPNRPLNRSQQRVLQLVAQGMSNPQVAAELGLSVLTVKAHLEHIGVRLGTHGRCQSVLAALQRGDIQ